ncbi:MAG: primosomal protein N', partial [Phycisphaerae bacterium]|nr:primosomal protein N' [Phycisphaerae bacterium]
ADALADASVTPATIQSLCKRGLVEIERRQEPRVPPVPVFDITADPPAVPEDALELTPGQEAARAAISSLALSSDGFRVFLLFGVPGSGKTEVYVRAIRQVVAAGRQAILIVPEIALATQVVERLARRFSRVAILHSQLTPRMRVETQRAIAAGVVDVVIGTRTAVFAPCPRLGLIVVDEEQETSLKNLAAPFFHARDVAIKRGQIQAVPVVLGSATPALETWHNAQHMGHYSLLRLPERVPGARLPEVRLLQTPAARVGRDAPLLAPTLADELRDTHAAGQQAILLHNRRGYAIYLRCSRCEAVLRCPRCDSHLVLHQRQETAAGERATPRGEDVGILKCHQCGHTEPVRTRCADGSCGGTLERGGLAIQRLEEMLKKLVPAARLLRLDSDTMKNRESYRTALHRFEAGDADIMLGTQMVAKGLDFPAVRLVGVIDADAALALPDFRSGERVLQLLMQVVGRAGRKEGQSLALVQSQDVTAPAIRAAIAMDYEGFATRELESRRRLGYPPFTRLARVVLLDEHRSRAREAAAELADTLRTMAGRVDPHLMISEPGACVVPRLREMYRYQVLVRGPRTDCIQRLLELARSEKRLRPGVKRMTIDVDAIDLL